MAAFLLQGCAGSGEYGTTWRAGDPLTYGGGCHTAADMVAVASAGLNANELFHEFRFGGRCFVLRRPTAAVLVRWVTGPFEHPLTRTVGSVWELYDAYLDTEYLWLGDHIGRHGGAAPPPLRTPALAPAPMGIRV
ncbi:MAG: hypothetical protein IH904_00155 [Proteobacteria bacterium]|nr:hypothetical protein [Pseudomonadota bacterium]